MIQTTEGPYTYWRQVAGYFDGDDCADYDVGKWVLHPKLSFCDNYRPHVVMLQGFLTSRSLAVWSLSHDQGGAWKIGVGQAESVRVMAERMLPHLFKKKVEVKAITDYLENRISGTRLVQVFNESVRMGNRTGKLRVVNIPYTRRASQALRRAESSNQARVMGERNQILPNEILERIRREMISGAATNGELAKKYGVNPSTISRAVFGRSDR